MVEVAHDWIDAIKRSGRLRADLTGELFFLPTASTVPSLRAVTPLRSAPGLDTRFQPLFDGPASNRPVIVAPRRRRPRPRIASLMIASVKRSSLNKRAAGEL